MSKLWSDHIASLVPYVPGEQAVIANLLKLNTNENPYGPSPKAIAAMQAAIGDNLRLYPDYQAFDLRAAIASLNNIKPEQVFLGNGSDEVLAHVFNAFFRHHGRSLLLPDISYSFYKTYCGFYNIEPKYQPLTADFEINVNDYINLDSQPAGIIFANPNAPTGKYLDLAAIAKIASSNPDVVVVVDEAYIDFGGQSAVKLIDQFKNLLVVHTMSKSRSLAGLRLGYAMGDTQLIAALLRVKDSFNSYPLDAIALAGAQAAIEDIEWFNNCCHQVIQDRDFLTKQLQDLGFEVLPSLANFVFARHPGHDAAEISLKLRKYGILVRHFKQAKIDQFLRITVGKTDQCQRLCDTLAQVLNTGD